MKIRGDFVSNSSSSSFIVKRDFADKLLDVVGRKRGYAVPYEWNNDITVNVYCAKSDYASVWKALHDSDNPLISDIETGDETENGIFPEPVTTSIGQLIDALPDAQLMEKIKYVQFRTYDDNSRYGVTLLRLLYVFFDTAGCCPDAGCSEIDFLHDDNDFSAKLTEYINKSKREKTNG